jgi:hypothetical protein
MWLRSLGVRAWFVHLLFTNDEHGPTTADQWAATVKTANQRLGLDGIAVDGAGQALLPAGDRNDLVG